MVVERWPGKPTVTTGFGTVGAFSLDSKLDDIVAKQHSVGGLVNGGTCRLFEPINTVNQFRDLKSRREAGMANVLKSMDIGGLSSYMARILAYESIFSMESSLIDVQVGRRISQLIRKSNQIIYADDCYVKYFDLNQKIEMEKQTGEIEPESDDSVYLNLRSPVLQVDKSGLIRTNHGLAITQSPESVDYFIEGDFMHADGGLVAAGSAVATSTDGSLMVLDIENESIVWQQKRSKGSINGWSRCVSLDPNLVLWCNRYSMATVDLREPPPESLYQRLRGSHFIMNFEDRERAIHALDAGIEGRDAFALTSYTLEWINGASNSQPLMSIEQPLAKEDMSTSIYVARNKQRNLVTVTSQLTPLTMAAYCGKKNGMPTMLDDLYYLESWPTIVPQSHITVENKSGFSLLSVGSEGGLFKQQWKETGREDVQDALIDLPPAEEWKGAKPKERNQEVKPFDLLPLQPFVTFYDFGKVGSLAFQPLPEANLPINEKYQKHLTHLGASTARDLQTVCEKAWLEPLKEKRKDGVEVSEDILRQTSRCINQMVHDMSNIEENPVDLLDSTKLDLHKDVQEVLKTWQDGESSAPEVKHLEQEIAREWSSQPAVFASSQSSLQSQPTLGAFSQPALGVSKKMKIKKKRKHRAM